MFRKRNLIILIVVILAGGAAWYYWGRDTKEEVPTETVKKGTVLETVSVTGKLVPSAYADLSFRAIGQIKNIAVKEGDAVKAGQVLATLDTAVIQAQLNDARTALAKAEETEMLARRNWKDLKPEEQQVQRLATEQAREDVRVVQAQMRDYSLKAPIAGTISQLDAREGEIATAGQALMRVAGEGELILEARVPESDIAKVAAGMRAQADFDALPSGEFLEAEVTEIDRAATVVQDVVSYVVKFRLLSADPRLREGMTADLDIETKKSENVLQVPSRSLTKENERLYAETLQADGSLRKVEVKIGIEGDDGTVEVKSGLQEGDRVTLGTKQKK